jgi:hypothetical protein
MIIYSSHTRERYPPIVQIITSPLLPFSPRIPEKKAGFNSGPRGSYDCTTVIPTGQKESLSRAPDNRVFWPVCRLHGLLCTYSCTYSGSDVCCFDFCCLPDAACCRLCAWWPRRGNISVCPKRRQDH